MAEAIPTPQAGPGFLLRICGLIGRWQQEVSDSIHAPGEKYAAEAGWAVTRSTGRFGFGARTYRDPRFDQLAAGRRADAGW
jgi:hypothetical protein